VPVHAFKAQIGHTLGAAGALEALACVDAMARGVLPASAGEGTIDAEAKVRLLEVGEADRPVAALKLSAAFGGANAALLLTKDPRPARPREARAVYVTRAVHVTEVPRDLEVAAPTLARVDRLVALGLAAVASLARQEGPLAGAGLVVGHVLATLETNALFDERIRARGARMAEPRRFPYTSPNAVAGECAIHFRLTGPSFAVGAGPTGALEAISVARDLVASGDADRIVVLAVDDMGPAAARLGLGVELETGAAAVLVTSAPAAARIGAIELGLGRPAEAPVACGHRALVPLAQNRLPNCLESRALGAFAKVPLLAL
jgi:3-oxoacyl-[acyl-carrier-protein] synthase-1/3-oxoacyl-[acyl-carrier-protein] synthase II